MSNLLHLTWYTAFVAVVMCFMIDLWLTIVFSKCYMAIMQVVVNGVEKSMLLCILSLLLYGDICFDVKEIVLKEIVWTDTENQFWVVFWLSYVFAGMHQLRYYHVFLIVVRLVKAFGKFYKQQFSGHETCTHMSRSMVAR